MRRKPGVLLPIELDILDVAANDAASADPWFHGYGLAKQLAEHTGAKRLTAHGTLYKALGRLADGGLLDQQWEDPDAATEQGRPRRRLYRITGLGQQALIEGRAQAETPLGSPRISPA